MNQPPIYLSDENWLKDMEFILGLSLREAIQDSRKSLLRVYLNNRYAPDQIDSPEKTTPPSLLFLNEIEQASLALQFCCDWVLRNLSYLEEIGMARDGMIIRELFIVLRGYIQNTPPLVWDTIPNIEPAAIIKRVQKMLDAKKNHPTTG